MEEKDKQRVELHLHTTTSDAVSVITPREAIETAIKMGHRAIAFTDLNSVQNFGSIAHWHKKYRDQIKVIYGVELYLDGRQTTVLAKNQAGLKNLYEVVSTEEITPEQRKNLLIASAYCDGELYDVFFGQTDRSLEEIASQYDYIELPHPNRSCQFGLIQRLYALGKKLGIPVVAVSNCTFIEPQDQLSVEVLTCSRKKGYLPTPFHTTQEMLKEYAGLGEKAAYEVVIANPNKLADSIEYVEPFSGNYPSFELPEAYEEVCCICEEQLTLRYGTQPPEDIRIRLQAELELLGDNASLYLLSHKLVKHLHEKGALTGYRGYIGSTLIAYLLDISDINPLPAHYRCPNCKHTEFADAQDGYDLPQKKCPHCGSPMIGDGHNIPFETCMGVDGAQQVDIDIQTAQSMCGMSERFLTSLLGKGRVAIAGQTWPYTERFAAFYADKFAEEYGLRLSDEERTRIIEKLSKVKQEERKWPGYILLPEGMDWENITPLRDVPNAEGDITKATHMDYDNLYDILPKLDVLQHRAYDQLQKLYELTGTRPMDINYQDPAVYTIFEKLDTCGIPEFSSDFTKGLLAQLGHIRFSELVSVSSMAHGTDAWNGNGEYLIKEHPICELISTRDDVFLTLRKFDIPRERAIIAMKNTRMGKYHQDTVCKQEMFDYLRWVGIPDWYLESMEKIRYLFPKAHAAHYTKLAVSLAWFKHYYPKEFYQVLLSGDDNEELLLCSNEELKRQLSLLDSSSYKERDAIKLLLEARQRGYIPAVPTS